MIEVVTIEEVHPLLCIQGRKTKVDLWRLEVEAPTREIVCVSSETVLLHAMRDETQQAEEITQDQRQLEYLNCRSKQMQDSSGAQR